MEQFAGISLIHQSQPHPRVPADSIWQSLIIGATILLTNYFIAHDVYPRPLC